MQIITLLEDTYGIDFSIGGVDPEQLGSIARILDLIDKQADPGQAIATPRHRTGKKRAPLAKLF